MTEKKYLKPIVSYTTRPKREKETDGVEHYFITSEQVKEILSTTETLAYTTINGYEYFTTVDMLKECNLYIIDPRGINNLRETHPNIKTKVIYVMCDNEVRIARAKSRDNEDFIRAFNKRNESENEQFTEFENNKQWDLLLDNTEYGNNSIDTICDFINRFDSVDDILFLVAGRTGSGKDYITTEAIKRINS